jgi:SAM-dependent methyltransferase
LNPIRRLARSPRLVGAFQATARRLPFGSDVALRGGRWAWRHVAGGPPQQGGGSELPRRYRPPVRPRPIGQHWPEPPAITDPGTAGRRVDHRTPSGGPYDIALMERLQAEYRDKPLVPVAPGRDAAERAERARIRLLDVHREIDLADQRVLEVGCGAGYEVWYLSHHFGSDAWGIDVVERSAWAELADDRTHYVLGDMTEGGLFGADSFDRVISFAVWEHIAHPSTAIAETFRILRPGGLAWIKANLHRGPMASHLYRDIDFPYPHLLFEDHVIAEFMRRRGKPVPGASWVNRLSWADYESRLRAAGFAIRALRFTGRPIDEDFYRRFEDILGRYPRTDLARDFFEVVVEKPVASEA